MLFAFLLASVVAIASTERIYSIAIGSDYGAQEYIDPEGYLTGFGHDVIDAVCRSGGIDCRIVWDSRDGNCWMNVAGHHPSGGRGIYARWFDGCSGWDATVERIHVFKFSAPFTKIMYSYFYYKKGGNFDSGNLAGKTIGIMQDWASNEKCIARQSNIRNNVLDTDHTKTYSTTGLLLAALLKGEVDAAFADVTTFAQSDIDKSLDFKSGSKFLCILAGNSIMMRKDSKLVEFWNVGLQKLMNTRKYQELCAASTQKHGHRGDLNCIS